MRFVYDKSFICWIYRIWKNNYVFIKRTDNFSKQFSRCSNIIN